MSTFDWEDYSLLADKLSMIQKEEYIRSAISRYYYGLFGLSRKYFIETKDFYQFSKKNSYIHKQISNELMKSNNSTEAYVGETLFLLRNKRNKADYDANLNMEYFLKDLNKIKNQTRKAIESIKYLKNNPSYI